MAEKDKLANVSHSRRKWQMSCIVGENSKHIAKEKVVNAMQKRESRKHIT